MAHKYPISTVARLVEGQLITHREDQAAISEILTDSRRLMAPSATLFFALQGLSNDGHHYIGELYDKGVRNFVIADRKFPTNTFSKANFVLVDDPLKALQRLAMAHRRRFSYPVIGITGSNGKTVVKEWLYQLLSNDYLIVRRPKSYNSQIGVPLSVWQMDETHQMAIFEAGISEPGEMEALRDIIQPTIGIFTNVGHAHDANFKDEAQKTNEKFTLFRDSSTLIYAKDYPSISRVLTQATRKEERQVITWGQQHRADVEVREVKKYGTYLRITAVVKGEEEFIEIPFFSAADMENAMHCWMVMRALDYPVEVIRERMRHLHPVEMRLELNQGIHHCTIVNDSYSLDMDSLKIALDFLNQNFPYKRKVIILSDFVQSGQPDRELYLEVAQLMKEKGADKLIGIGAALSRFSELFSGDTAFFPSTEAFIAHFSFSDLNNDAVLVKGARIFGFERINQVLQKKDHETVLQVNMEAIIHNLNCYRERLQPGVKIMAMVKAFSYGSGSVEIASLLQHQRVDYLAVAFTDEGIELRENGIALPILVLNPEQESFPALLNYGLEPEIYSLSSLERLLQAVEEMGFSEGDKPVAIHLKIDTGMHRLGFLPEDIPLLIRRLKEHPQVVVHSIFSHLAASGNDAEDDFTRGQIARFSSLSDTITEALGYATMRHLLNSDGAIRFPEAQFEMVRLGISLYGISSLGEFEKSLENVCSLKSTLSQIKRVAPGESVGYERSFVAREESRIAVVPIGYADGLSRAFSDGVGLFYVHGHACRVVGKICMDMCMINVTGIDCQEGDEVVIFDEHHPLTTLASRIQTIPYELLSSISQRVKRVYYH
ncbi:MAG: bifunctional UDP-N-acetylmuramoyl-tripeptide:D-alanyl-D-alanine ligase/alanine racemase [Bacteroidetes bacterium]|nr:MAG: bifunctional UDP-N-acetylmuramoyl-tripeptide:D-alanyl-D-alanine ligase/alanine racemase [Bacteroidota bacterium]